jgi:HK97 family phage portal protein
VGLLSLAQKAFRAVGRPFVRAGAGVDSEAKAAAQMRHPTYGTSGIGGSFGGYGPISFFLNGSSPNPDFDYAQDVADVWLNGAVGACLGWISDNFTQPELQVVRKKRSGLYEPVDDHGLVSLISEPNPEYDADALWAATVLSFVASGNAYWIKAKAPAGSSMYLWYVPHFEMYPVWGTNGTSFIDFYEHVVDGQRIRVDKENVVHFRRGLNPNNVRSGLPQLDPVIKEIATDNAGSMYCAAVLRNYGVGSIMISPAKSEDTINDEDAKVLVKLYQERTTGENRGKPIVASGGIKVDQLSFSPEKLALDKMRTFPEDRICAAMRLNPMVVGLTSGSAHKTYANYGESLNAAWDNCMVPLQRRFAKALTRQLLPDLGGVKDRDFVEFDYSTVPAMADDEDAKAKRVALLFQAKVIKRGKACELLNLECPPEDDLYINEPLPGQEPIVPPPGMPGAPGNGRLPVPSPGRQGANGDGASAEEDGVPAAQAAKMLEVVEVAGAGGVGTVEMNGNGRHEAPGNIGESV